MSPLSLSTSSRVLTFISETVAIVCCAGTSGGHLSPSFTIAFVLFKGFPIRKAPYYIVSQIAGAFVGALIVAAIFHQQLAEVTAGMKALGLEKAIFSAQGVRISSFCDPSNASGTSHSESRGI